MEARDVTSPGKANDTNDHLAPTSIPFTLPGAFGLEALAPALLRLTHQDACGARAPRRKGE